MRTIASILTILILSSCRHEFKDCDFDSTDKQLKIYNDILTELIEQRFYNRYLGEHEESIFKESVAENADTAKIKRDIIRLQNNLFNDTAQFCNIYLDTLYRPQFNRWTYYQTHTGQYITETKELIDSFSANGQEVIDSLNTMQDRYAPNDFQLCTSAVLSLRDLPRHRMDKCHIGIVGFSKVFLNKEKTKGLLYYDFFCGGLCGMGELLVIENTGKKWIITNNFIQYIR